MDVVAVSGAGAGMVEATVAWALVGVKWVAERVPGHGHASGCLVMAADRPIAAGLAVVG